MNSSTISSTIDDLSNAPSDAKQFLGAIVLQQKHQANPGAPSPTADDHADVVGVLGNLTLLTGKHNERIANQGWDQKRQRFANSDWIISRDLAAKKRWDSRAIIQRTDTLATWIVKRWPPL